MKKIYTFLLLALIFLIPAISSATLPGLIGSGEGEVRYLGIFKVYDANIYLPPQTPQNAVLDSATSKCLKLDYAVSLKADDLIAGGETVLERQHNKDILDNVRKHIDTLHNSYVDIKSGDSYTLCYDSTSSTTTLLHNSEQVAAIQSSDFANVYFGIWLGQKAPLDDGLRDSLLKQLPK